MTYKINGFLQLQKFHNWHYFTISKQTCPKYIKKQKISQKSKELHIINQMKISKEVKQELIRSTKNKNNGLNSYEQEKAFEEEITILHSQTCLTRDS